MQTAEASIVSKRPTIKSVSAVKKRPSGYQKRQNASRGGRNVLWKRVTSTFDDDLVRFAKNPAIVAPLTRLVFFEHLTKRQGMAGRRYRSIMRKFERYHLAPLGRAPRSASLEPVRNIEDQELERHIRNCTMAEYEKDAKHAKKQYERVMKVLNRFADDVTGRNVAKDTLDDLVLADKEPPSELRASLGIVLSALADEFGIEDRKGRNK